MSAHRLGVDLLHASLVLDRHAGGELARGGLLPLDWVAQRLARPA